jgi:phosphotransferase system IIA component
LSYPLNKLRFVEKSQTPQGFSILAPVTGAVYLSESIDQQVINATLLGEGVIVQLTGNKIVAPFDGVVSELPGSCHRIQLTANNGIKLVIAMANDIIQLMGLGLEPQVKEKQKVVAGQPLLNLNLQQLQRISNPCYCGIFVTNAEQLGYIYCSAKKVTAAEDVLLTLTAKQK